MMARPGRSSHSLEPSFALPIQLFAPAVVHLLPQVRKYSPIVLTAFYILPNRFLDFHDLTRQLCALDGAEMFLS
jgi:hypothetical protein